MAIKNSLDVYKVILKKKNYTFKKLINDKYNSNNDSSISNSALFNLLYKAILTQLTREVWKHPDTKIGLTIFKARGIKENKILSSHSSNFVIEGFIDGGAYDMVRRLANLSKTKSQNIKKDDIITDRYYIYMHLPLNSNIGVVFLQSKNNANIRPAIKKFMPEICKNENLSSCKIESYIPNHLKQEFKDGAIIHSLTFTQQFVSEINETNEATEHEEAYNVIIQIQPKDQSIEFSKLDTFLNKVGDMTMKVGNRIKPLSEFDKKRGSLRNDDMNNTSPFIIDNEDKVRPVINLEDVLIKNSDGDFNREELKSYCDEILRQISTEIYCI